MSKNPLSETYYSSAAALPEHQTGDLQKFLTNLFNGQQPEYATFSFALDGIDPLAYLEMCWEEDLFQYYWELPANEFAIAAGGTVEQISSSGSQRFNDVSSRIDAIRKDTAEHSSVPHPYSGMMFLGGLSFGDEITDELWNKFEPASFTIPKWTIVKDGKFNLATLVIRCSSYDSPEALHNYLIDTFEAICETCRVNDKSSGRHSTSTHVNHVELPTNGTSGYEQWKTAVEKATSLIGKNNFEKIVLARKISVDSNNKPTPTEIINRLRNQYTNCYNFLIHQQGNTFLGSSPERLGSFRNRLLLTEALAGSIQRGQTATEDTVLEQNLSDSSKNRDEHNFVVKDIEQRLSPFTHEVHRSEKPEVKKFLNVQHLYTPIRAQLNQDAEVLEVIGELHPTPAVGGYPWEQAAPYLQKLEDFDRGWYASPVGWLNSKGMGEFAVGIRSGLLTEHRAHFFAGCGIVADSDPATEWEETNLKLKPMLSALQYD
jgi:menaquinone-specific isochorismate synthase